MKLIAETQQESKLIDGLSALLCDLGVEVDSYQQDEAIAVTFVSTDDITIPQAFQRMTQEERSAFLHSIEDNMRSAMLAAGYRTIERSLCLAMSGVSHPARHMG